MIVHIQSSFCNKIKFKVCVPFFPSESFSTFFSSLLPWFLFKWTVILLSVSLVRHISSLSFLLLVSILPFSLVLFSNIHFGFFSDLQSSGVKVCLKYYCQNPNPNSNKTQHNGWVWHENDCANHPTPPHPTPPPTETFQPLLDQLESWNLAQIFTRPI